MIDQGPDDGWRIIPQAPRYAVNEQGTIKNYYSNVVVLQTPNEEGDMTVMLNGLDSRVSHLVLVKKIVAQMYLPEYDRSLDVIHRNKNKKDNRAANLQYGTRRLMAEVPNRPPIRVEGIRGRPKIRVRVVETNTVYDSIAECALAIDGRQSNISGCLRGRQKNHRGYTFEYAEWE